MGAGWVNELIARLTDSTVSDETSTNRTMDKDEDLFPLGGKRIFVVCRFKFRPTIWLMRKDFSHDNEMIEIMTALNIIPVS